MNAMNGFIVNNKICRLPDPPSRIKIDNRLVFDNKLRTVDKEFITGIGLTTLYDRDAIYGWGKITMDVPPHIDYGQPTLLYIGSGACRFIYGDHETTISLCSGDFIVFNDAEPHGVILESKTVVFMIASVTGYVKDKAVKRLDQFRGNYR